MPLKGSTSTKRSIIDLKQRRFGHRTRNARPRPSLLGSDKAKRQSSLTQLDFTSTPRPPDITDTWSDNEEDVDFEEQQPRKRQRTSSANSNKAKKGSGKNSVVKLGGKEKGQNTLTQICPWVSSSRKQMDDIEDESDVDFNIYNEEGRDRYTTMVSEQQKSRKRQLPWLRCEGEAGNVATSTFNTTPIRRYNLRSPTKTADTLDDSGYVSNSVNGSAIKPYNLREPLSAKKPAALDEPSGHSIATRDFHTPQKSSRMKEIPSSQTPQSVNVSSQRSQQLAKRRVLGVSPLKERRPMRSPLKEKSTNMQPQGRQPEPLDSHEQFMKKTVGSQLPRLVSRVDVDTFDRTPALANCGKTDVLAQAPTPTPPVRRKLKRISTVQDSQADDFEPTQPAEWTRLPPQKLKRTATVQDSQYDDLILSSPIRHAASAVETVAAISEAGKRTGKATTADKVADEVNDTADEAADEPFSDEQDNYENDEYQDDEPHTYDPIGAALERDAARFKWTQTQLPVTSIDRSMADSEDNEEDEDDLDRGVLPAADHEDDVVLLRSLSKKLSQERGSGLADLPERDAAPAQLLQATDQVAPRGTVFVEPMTVAIEVIASSTPPSSPPTIRQSQISTIVPTQTSPYQQQLTHLHEYSPPTSPPARQLATNIQRKDLRSLQPTQSYSMVSSSSSPLPLPPWSSPERVKWITNTGSPSQRQKKADDELSSLVDFSLPPPPPLTLRSSSPWTSR